jgi:hypothetical protein
MGGDCRRRGARVVLAAAVILTITPVLTASAVHADTPADLPALPSIPTLDPTSPSLSPGGRAFLQGASLADAPRYALSATIDPVTGKVDGRMRAEVPRPERGDLQFRMLAGLPALHTGFGLKDVTVGGKTARAKRDRALVTVPVPPKASGKIVVGMRFSYRAPRAGTTHGRPLTQATIALLSTHPDVSQFGHWFPLWLPPGADADPALSGFGDIGNFAAGAITARVRVPTGYDVVSGGVTVDQQASAGHRTVTESGVGLRDLSLAIGRGLHSASAQSGDVTVRATGPASVDVAAAARGGAADLQTLAGMYGPYPWSELDIVAVSLGPDAGGMEWPGAVWIAGLENGVGGVGSLAVDHELAHQWWHALVGNDSIRAPVVDEPLAQYSMCLVAAQQNDVGGECGGVGGGLGVPGGATANNCADRPTTAFASSNEYGALVYDQAPNFYFALAGVAGRDATVAALRDVVARHAFGIITPEELRDEIAAALPGQADTVRALWDRYIGPPGCGS